MKIVRSFRFGMKGLRHAYRSDKSFRMEINYGLPIYLVVGYLLLPLETGELLFFILSYMLILSVELLNTSIEFMLERLHPEQHELIGKCKDVASGAVLISFLFAMIVVAVLVYARVSLGTPVLIPHTFV